MFRRDIVLKVGGFNPAFVGADDQELYLRIAREYPIHCHHEVVAEYRRHDGQGSKKVAQMLAASMAMMQAQRPHVAGRARHLEAYREGIRYRRALYSETLFWQGVQAARTRAAADAVACLAALLRHDPGRLVSALSQRLLAARPA
jgi:hypothetical protein